MVFLCVRSCLAFFRLFAGAVTVVTLLTAGGCAHRGKNEQDAVSKTIISKPQSGERYVQKALHLHELRSNPLAVGAKPSPSYFCAYLIEAETDFQGSGADFVYRNLKAGQFKPLNIGRLERHYGFTQEMFDQGIKSAKTQAKLERLLSKPVAFLDAANLVVAGVRSLVTKDSFKRSQSQDQVDQSAQRLRQAGDACRLPGQIKRIESEVKDELQTNTARRLVTDRELDFDEFNGIVMAISSIAETQDVKRQGLCPAGENLKEQLLAPFERLCLGGQQ